MKSPAAPAFAVVTLTLLVCAIVGVALYLLTQRQPPPAPLVIPTRPPTRTPTSPPPSPVVPTPSVAPITATPATIGVYVTGAVVNPNQVHLLPAGSRVADAISAAGGVLPDADMTRLNLAAYLQDTDQVHVYALEPGQTPAPSSGGETTRGAAPSESVAATSSPFPVRINSASAEELEAVPEIGPVMAARIIAFREARGRIDHPDLLLEVAGIGVRTLEAIRPYLSFE